MGMNTIKSVQSVSARTAPFARTPLIVPPSLAPLPSVTTPVNSSWLHGGADAIIETELMDNYPTHGDDSYNDPGAPEVSRYACLCAYNPHSSPLYLTFVFGWQDHAFFSLPRPDWNWLVYFAVSYTEKRNYLRSPWQITWMALQYHCIIGMVGLPGSRMFLHCYHQRNYSSTFQIVL